MKQFKTIQVGNNIYQFRYSINQLCALEDLLGKPVSQLGSNTGIRELRLMFYCGVTPKMTLEEAGDVMADIIEEKGIDYLSTLLSEAIEKSIGTTTVAPEEVYKKKD